MKLDETFSGVPNDTIRTSSNSAVTDPIVRFSENVPQSW